MIKTSAHAITANSSGVTQLIRWIGFLLALSLLGAFQYATAATTAAVDQATVPADQVLTNQKFDHTKTGYILTGAHYTARCASCHINGILKGTPRECASCHVVGNRMAATAKPVNHIITQDKCDTCHKTNLWTPAQFSHVGIVEGTCATCHNGTTSTGKPRNHFLTSASCDTCHKTLDWRQISINHRNIHSGCGDCHSRGSPDIPGFVTIKTPVNHIEMMGHDCVFCHYSNDIPDGFKPLKPGTSMPVNHVQTALPCAACHNPSGFLPGNMNHTGIFTGCAACHTGQHFAGTYPPANPLSINLSTHYPITMGASSACESCHLPTRTNSGDFTGATMNHIGIIGNCAACHNGTPAYANTTPIVTKADMPNGQVHMTTSDDCSGCHTSTSSFSGASPTVIPPNHIPTGNSCTTCHAGGNYGPVSGVMGAAGHAGLTSCTICHSANSYLGGPFMTKADAVPTHIDTSADCSTCHLPSLFNTGGFKGASGGTTLPNNHVPTTLSCSGCHTTGFGVASGLKPSGDMVHTGITTACATCHNGTSFYGVKPKTKSSNHYPTSAVANGSACETCHSNTKTLIGEFMAGRSVMNHTGITGNCGSCHNGNPAYANSYSIVTKASYTTGAGHVSTASDCSKCHLSTTSFAGGASTEMPGGHVPTSLSCTICHTTGFGAGSGLKSSGDMVHTGITTACADCHNGTTYYGGVKPLPKSISHQATSLDCSNCHLPSSFVKGGFVGASGGTLPANHVPTTQSCTLCHISGTGSGSGKMSHTGIAAGCSSCHGKTPSHFLGVDPVPYPSGQPAHLTTSLVSWDSCQTCHSTTSFNGAKLHLKVTVTSGCATCHTNAPGLAIAGGVTPKPKQNNHVPTNLVANGAACETCHKLTSTFSGTAMVHTGITANCTNCHNGQIYDGVTPKSKSPTAHIPYATSLLGGATMQCELCHSKTVFTSFTSGLASSSTQHNGSKGNGSGWCKDCHATGKTYTGVTGKKEKVTHKSSSATDCSQSGCHAPLGGKGSAYSNWD